MLINRKEFLHAIKFLLPAIGQNESRRALTNLYVENIDSQCVLTAADAYIIKQVKLDIATDNNKPKPRKEKPFLILLNLLIFYRQIIGKAKNQDFINISRKELSTLDHSLKYKQPEVEYPNLKRLIDGPYLEQNPSPDQIGLNTHFLSECSKDFPNDTRYKGSVVKILFSGGKHTGAVKLTNQQENYISIIMCVKVQW